MGLGAMDDVPLSAIAFAKPRAKKETRESKAGTRGKEKGSREAEKKTASEKAGKSAGGVAAGKVAKKETAAERRAAVGVKKGKKAVAAAAKNGFLSVGRVTNEGGVDHVSVDEPFGGGGAGNAFGTRLGLGGFGAPAGDSFAFEHERGAGDGSGSTHEDFELLFDVDDSGGATGGAEGVLTGGFRDLFAS
jgi:membrane protein involved in colicin uptake